MLVAASDVEADRRERIERLSYVEQHLKTLAEMAEGYPLLRHLLGMAVMESSETLERERAELPTR
jgi:hypothetical protein